jgi:long-chain acyl-CoA synthetase
VVEKIRVRTSLETVVVTNYRDLASPDSFPLVPAELTLQKSVPPDTRDMLEILQRYSPEAPTVDINLWEDVGLIVYTSGTTGRPKGAMLTFGNALFKVASSYHFSNGCPDDVSLAVMPINHIAGNVMGLGTPVYGGFTCVLLARYDPETMVTATEKYRCTSWYGTTPMYLEVMKHPEAVKRDLSSLRYCKCTSFGVTLSQDIATQWEHFTGGCHIYEMGYGLSETHTGDAMMPHGKPRYGATGIPVFDTDVRIVDPEKGLDLGPNEPGEIALRNPGVFKGYLHRPEATAETLRQGWVFTGDIGKIDDDGYLYFMGRIKEMIKCSGYSVFPEEVEIMLLRHPAVARVAVVGVPDPARGESVKAFIVPKPEYKDRISEKEIISWSREKMAAYKYPRAVEFRDNLPATGAGKVLRRLLKKEEQP